MLGLGLCFAPDTILQRYVLVILSQMSTEEEDATRRSNVRRVNIAQRVGIVQRVKIVQWVNTVQRAQGP